MEETDASGPDSEEDMVQEEYENEEQVATVTVVEDFDMDTLIHPGAPSGHRVPDSSNLDQDQSHQTKPSEHRTKVPKSASIAKTQGASKMKTRSEKKIKYETKAARLAEKRVQRARKLEKAARAGGRKSRLSKKRM